MFTKGKWKVGEPVASQGKLVYIPIYADGKYSSSVSVYSHKSNGQVIKYKVPENEVIANAHLIAASPKLYEALKAYQTANRLHNDSESELFDKADMALRQAEGRE